MVSETFHQTPVQFLKVADMIISVVHEMNKLLREVLLLQKRFIDLNCHKKNTIRTILQVPTIQSWLTGSNNFVPVSVNQTDSPTI